MTHWLLHRPISRHVSSISCNIIIHSFSRIPLANPICIYIYCAHIFLIKRKQYSTVYIFIPLQCSVCQVAKQLRKTMVVEAKEKEVAITFMKFKCLQKKKKKKKIQIWKLHQEGQSEEQRDIHLRKTCKFK